MLEANFWQDKNNSKNVIKEKKLSRKQFVEVEIESRDIKSYAIQGYWYFDKRLAELKYRLVAIGPRATPADVKVNAEKNKKKIQADAKQKAKDDGERQMTQQEDEDMQKAMANEDKNSEPTILFWIYYPSIRSVLKKQKGVPAVNVTGSPILVIFQFI